MSIFPTPGDPNVNATASDQWLIGEPNYNYIGYSGATDNTVSYQLATGSVTASLANPSINTGAAAGDTYTDIQNLTGSMYGGALYGNNSGQTEQLWALGGTTYMYGGSGYTTFISGDAPDYMYAGQGGGLADYEVATSGVVASLANPSMNTGWAAGDAYSNIHNIAGSAYDDILIADNSGDNMLGGDGNNILIGGTGNDTLNGGPGANILTGGGGSNWFVFGGSAIGPGDVTMDPLSLLYTAETGTYSRITDFNQAYGSSYNINESDRIDVSKLVSSLNDGSDPVSSLVQVVEDTSGAFAWLEFNGPTGWVTLARMDGLQAGDTVGVILNETNPTGYSVTVQPTPLTNETTAYEWVLKNGHWSESLFPGSVPGSDWQVAGTGNFTGNGTDGILWYNVNSGDVADWQLSNGQWAASADFGNLPFGWQIEGTGNFFGKNSDSDILLYNAGDNQADIWEVSNDHWVASIDVGSLPLPVGWQVAAIGDFTGNGTSDILWQNTSTGDVADWLMQNGHWAGSVDFGAAPAGLQIAGAGNFFGSNAPSGVLWFNPNTGATDIWEMSNGHWDGTINVGTIPGSGWQVAGIGDFTGNCTSDILWHNTNTGDIAEWLMQNGHWAASVDLGSPPPGLQVAGVGDFTHNGTSDVLLTQHALT